MALDQTVTIANSGSGQTSVNDDGNRAPRLPRWTRQEILVLIQGKRVAENRVRRGRVVGPNQVEPKWAAVSAYCKRHGVNRGPVQCRKRWSNLSGDYKKIKEWELHKSGESESFWVMRNDLRRERKLPGFFDREVYDILDGGGPVAETTEEKVKETDDEETSDYDPPSEEGVGRGGDDPDKEVVATESPKTTVTPPMPIFSEKQYQPICKGSPERGGMSNEKQQHAEKGSPSEEEGRKRKRSPSEDDLQDELIKVLERNGRMVTSHLEAQNINCELDRDQRKDQTNSLVAVLSKLADALERIADKL